MPKHVIESQLGALSHGGGSYRIAASDASAREKANADYILTGTDDDLVINPLIDTLYTSGGGKITFSPGNVYLSSTLSLYDSVSVTTPTVILEGSGMDATYFRPTAGTHAITVGKSVQGAVRGIHMLLDGSSDGIRDIDGLVSADGIGWRMRHFIIEDYSFSGSNTHTGWGINIQPFRMIIRNIEGNTGPTGWTYPANGIKLSARSTPNPSSTFNAGDSIMQRVQISLSGLQVGQRAIWIDTDDSGAANYDSSYFNQMVFEWIGLRSNVSGRGTAFQIGHSGSNKTRSIMVLGMDMEQFAIGIDLYNAQGCIFETFYTSPVTSNNIYWRTDNTGTVNNTVNNWWRSGGTVGVFNSTQDVIIDLNSDANNPNTYEHFMVETSGGVARINGSTSAALPAGVIVKNIGGIQRSGTRHPAFNEPLQPQSTVSGLATSLSNKADAYANTSNLVPNPSFEVDYASWSNYNSPVSVARDNTLAQSGTWSSKQVAVSATDSGIKSSAITLTPGTYYFSVYASLSSGVTNASMVIRAITGLVVGVQINQTYPGNTNFNRYGGSFTVATTGTYEILLGLGSYGTASTGTVYYDAVQLESGTQTAYMDGSLAATSTLSYSWAGTAHNSISTRRSLNIVTSVNGQVGAVTVSGGGTTNLSTTAAPTTVTVNSSTGTGAAIAAADATNAGLMLPAEKTKLTGIATGATANSTDATLLARANHTGTQTASTISDFSTAADARITAAAGTTLATLSSGKIPSSQLPAVGLVTVQTAASQAAQLALTTQEGDVVVRTDTNVTYMRNSGVTGTMTDFTLLNTPTDAVTSVNSQTGVVVLGKTDVGLGNVDNTSDATKNAAVATLTNKTLTSPAITTPTGIVKGDVGLGNVDNTSDATKNAATATLTNKTIDTATGSANVIKINGNTLTAGAGTATITLPSTSTTLAGIGLTQTLTNKTIDTAGPNTIKINGNTLSATAGTATVSIPNSTDTLVGLATTDTLTNKNLTSGTNTFPTFNQSTTGNAATATAASGLASATTTVAVNAATAPTAGQVLVATSSTAASWQQPYNTASLAMAPTGATAETLSRMNLISVFGSGIGSGTLYLRAIYIPAGVTVNNITMVNGGTAEAGGTHGWYVLLDSSRVVKAVTADQTTNAWGTAAASVTLPVTAGFTTTYGGLYYLGVCVVATTMPTILGAGNLSNNAIMGIAPIMMGISSTAQTTPPALGATMTAITASSTYNFYGYTS